MIKTRFQSGSAIVEVIDHAQNDGILLTVSKERWDEDHVQIKLDRHVARALGHILTGEEPEPTAEAESADLRRLCNRIIERINTGSGAKTPGFQTINDLLKACDRVFAAQDGSA